MGENGEMKLLGPTIEGGDSGNDDLGSDKSHIVKPKKKKGGWPKGKSRGKKKTVISKTVNDVIPEPEKENAYQRMLREYRDGTDGDAKTDEGPDSLIDDRPEQGDRDLEAGDRVEKKKPMGKSLVAMTKFVIPALCAIGIRIASKNKKKVSTEQFQLTQYDVATLNELADDAADEILGRVNPAYSYLIVLVALASGKIVEAWEAEEKKQQQAVPMKTVSESEDMVSKSDLIKLQQEFDEYREKHNAAS